MRKILNIKVFLMALLAFSFVLVSCEDDQVKDTEAPRIFRPTGFDAAVSGVNVTLTWNSIPGATSYTVQVSNDSLDYSNPIVEATIEEKVFIVGEMEGGRTYYARIKSNSKEVGKDSFFAETVIVVPVENLFNNFGRFIGVVDAKTVQLAWLPGMSVTKLRFTSGAESVTFDITEEELESGLKTGMELPINDATYFVELLNDDAIRGRYSLRVEGDIFVKLGDDLGSKIMGASARDIIVLTGNQVFVHEGTWNVEAGKPLTIKGGPGANKAVFAFSNGITGSTCIAQPFEGVEYLKFENIELVGAYGGEKESPNANWAPHFINMNGEGTINKLIVENSIISHFDRNFIRYRSTSKMDSLVINNSIVNFNGGRGDYHVVVMENDSYINDIVFSNSTIVGSNRGLVRNNSNVATNSFRLEYCTVNDMVDAGRIMIEMKNAIKNIVFSNSILGKTRGAAWDATVATGGIFGKTQDIADAVFSAPGSYALADFSQNESEVGQSRKIDVPAYGGTSKTVFQDADKLNFRIIDSGFGGRGIAGDPRWW